MKSLSIFFLAVFILALAGCGEDEIGRIKKTSVLKAGGEPTYDTLFAGYRYCTNGKWSAGKGVNGQEIVVYQCEYDKKAFLDSYREGAGNSGGNEENIQGLTESRDPLILVWSFYPPDKDGTNVNLDIRWKYSGGKEAKGMDYDRRGPALFLNSFDKNKPLPASALPENY